MSRRKSSDQGPSLAFVSTYPPTRCGLATFTHSLVSAIADGPERGRSVGVVRLADVAAHPVLELNEVVGHLNPHRPESVRRAAALLDRFDVTIVQHEFGIYGPDDGESVLDLVQQIASPLVVTLHTVLTVPSPRQRAIVEALADAADVLVVMSRAARTTLERCYSVDPAKVCVVPHGAHGYRAVTKAPGARPVILTWGLIGPGKGIEWAVRAMPRLRAVDPLPLYRIFGATHPNVLRAEGERYREHILELARELRVEDMVEIEGDYLDHDALSALVGAADVVLLPYDSHEQVTSGVLIEAISAHKPVVATEFPHAAELLAGGAGLVVPHRDPAAIATSLERLLCDRAAYETARTKARDLARSLAWSSVAGQYRELAEGALDQQHPRVA